jgi:adenine-specific DNA methylase
MSIPYMGSKRKSAGKIYQTIINLSSKFDTICDLFCGGFAVSELFRRVTFPVLYNE